MSVSEQPLVACCLSTGEYQSRIEGLARKSLREHASDNLVLRLFYVPEAVAEVRRLVEQERICCAFLAFDLDQRADAVCITILGHILVNDGCGLHDIREGHRQFLRAAIADLASGSQRILRRLDPVRF
jgi:hypothetical protein